MRHHRFYACGIVDVVTGVLGLVIVDDAITNRGRFVPSWCKLRMN
jgi:hypothetical protein